GIAFTDRRHSGPDRLDYARALVPEDDRNGVGDRAVDDAQIRVAEAGRLDRNPALARSGIADHRLLDRDRTIGAVEDGSLAGPCHAGFPMRSTPPGRLP